MKNMLKNHRNFIGKILIVMVMKMNFVTDAEEVRTILLLLMRKIRHLF